MSAGPNVGGIVLKEAVAARSGGANPIRVAERANAETKLFERFSNFPGHDFGERGEGDVCVFIDRGCIEVEVSPQRPVTIAIAPCAFPNLARGRRRSPKEIFPDPESCSLTSTTTARDYSQALPTGV
jgi:hypothetical protein